MAYEVPPLPYGYDALAPTIDEETMHLHHDKHHQAYVDALNKALADQPSLQGKSIDDLLHGLNDVPESIRTVVRNNGGGHANHSMFWKLMAPGGTAMPKELQQQIDADFGSVDAMKEQFEAAGVKRFGSGWVFVLFNPQTQKLEIESTPNQDSPQMLGKTAVFGNDVWEHAYYLTYRNRRPEYLKTWWNVANWTYIAERLAGLREGKVLA